jgi:DNA-binding GntR family transcriptional regulator
MPVIKSKLLPKIPRAERSSVANHVYEALLSRIMKLELKPYAPISENAIAEEYGVSRTPVREAMARLANQHLLDVYPQRGTYISPLRMGEVVKAQFVREALECSAVRIAAENSDDEFIKNLKIEIKKQTHAMENIDHTLFFELDEQFHRLIFSQANLGNVWDEIAPLKLHMDRFRYLAVPDVNNSMLMIQQHTIIVKNIENHAIKELDRAVRTHTRRLFMQIPEFRQRYKDYFDTEDDYDWNSFGGHLEGLNDD